MSVLPHALRRMAMAGTVLTALAVVLSVLPAPISADAAAAEEPCTERVHAGQQVGWTFCGWAPATLLNYHPDGYYTREIVVVGVDYRIYSAWQRFPNDDVWAPWTEIPGKGRSHYNGPTVRRVRGMPDAHNVIRIRGTDKRYYCNFHGYGGWSGWKLDDGPSICAP